MNHTGKLCVALPLIMNKIIAYGCLLGVSCLLPDLRADVQVVKETKVPNSIRHEAVVLPADWSDRIPASPRVNVPEFIQTLYPGQKIALALMAEGPDRERLFDGLTLNVRITSPTKGVVEQHDLKAVTIRQIKAEGADMALLALKAGGIAPNDQAALETATALVSMAVFQPAWAAPLSDKEEEVKIEATLVGSKPTDVIAPVSLKVRPLADWLSAPAPSKEEMGRYMTRYHDDMAPGQLLVLLKAAADNGGLNVPSVFGFFTAAYRENAGARSAAIAALPSLDMKTQFALLLVFRLGGQDIAGLATTLPQETLVGLKAVEPLKDPRKLPVFQDPVDVEEVRGVGNTMDECWGGWVATGDPSFLRVLVGLLAGAPDFPAYQNWTKVRGGAKGLNAQIARGLYYPIAGWSIGSFQRTDPLVADWLSLWENDQTLSPLVRKEISSLPGNPAFRRN
jgi:hypothetical protein